MYGLATITIGGKPTAAINTGDSYWPINISAQRVGLGELPDSLIRIIDDWTTNEPVLAQLEEAATSGSIDDDLAVPASAAELCLALQYPKKVLCTGANYHDHLAEMKVDFKKNPGDHVFFFLKPPTTSLVGPGKTVKMQIDTRMLDWEIELAAVIGKRGRHVAVDDALDYIMGYTIAVDFSPRDLLMQPDSIFKFNFFWGKAQDTGCPIGPEIIPSRFIQDPQNLTMELKVNDNVKQHGNTADMIFSVAEQVASASRYVTLEPGDLILTGTCSGVGYPRQNFLRVGDHVSAEIEKIGRLDVEIIEPDLTISGIQDDI